MTVIIDVVLKDFHFNLHSSIIDAYQSTVYVHKNGNTTLRAGAMVSAVAFKNG